MVVTFHQLVEEEVRQVVEELQMEVGVFYPLGVEEARLLVNEEWVAWVHHGVEVAVVKHLPLFLVCQWFASSLVCQCHLW